MDEMLPGQHMEDASDQDQVALEAAVPAPVTASPRLPPAVRTVASATFTQRVVRTLRRWGKLGLGLGSLSLAFAGTLLLRDEGRRDVGVLFLLVAAGLAVLAWGAVPLLPAFDTREDDREWPLRGRNRISRLLGVALSLLLVWRADVYYLAHQDQTFGAAGWLWLASIGVLIAATARWPQQNDAANTVREQQGTHNTPDAPPPGTALETALFVGVVLLAVGLRLWRLQDLPFEIKDDELSTGIFGHLYLRQGSPSIFSLLWDGHDLPGLWFAAIGASFAAFGHTLAALRLPAALAGAMTVIPFYGLVRAVWGRVAALSGASVLAFSASNLEYSRVTVNNIVTAVFWASCFFFLLRGLRRRRPLDWVLAGLSGGLSEYGYYGTRILSPLLAVFFVYMLIVHWQQTRRSLGLFGLLLLSYLVAFGPLLAEFSRDPSRYISHGRSVLLWNHIPQSWADFHLMWATLWPVVQLNLLAVSTIADTGTYYYAPLLFPVEAALLVVGLVLMIWHWRHPAVFLLLIAGVSTFFAGGTLVLYAPWLHHWTSAFPTIYAAIAVPVGALTSATVGHSVQRKRRIRRMGGAGLVLGVSILGFANIDFYFNRYYAAQPMFGDAAGQARWAAALGPNYLIRTVGWNGPYLHIADYTSYLTHDQDDQVTDNPAIELPLPGKAGSGIGFIFVQGMEQYLPVVRALYPGGTTHPVASIGEAYSFTTYVVQASQVQRRYGVRLRLEGLGSNYRWIGQVRQVGDLPPEVRVPVQARWSTRLQIPHAGMYRFLLKGTPPTQVSLDGKHGLPSGKVELLPGWHQLSIEARLGRAQGPRLLLADGDSPATEVPSMHLWPSDPSDGLQGVVVGTATSSVLRVDPFIGFTSIDDPSATEPDPPMLVGPFLGPDHAQRARWVGELQVPMTGIYTLDLRTEGQALLSLDNQPVAMHCPIDPVREVPRQILLSAGAHSLQLDFSGRHLLEVYWTPPGMVQTLIPAEALHHSTRVAAPAVVVPDTATCHPGANAS